MEWFRLWHDYFEDPKLRRLSKAQRYDLLSLLRIASGNTPRGQMDLDDEDLAAYLEISDEDFGRFAAYLLQKEILERTLDGRLKFINWPKRQPASDNVAARVARHRALKQTETDSETVCNVTVTNRTEQNREEHNITEQRREDAHARPPSWESFKRRAEMTNVDPVTAQICWNYYEVKGWPNGGAKWDLLLQSWVLRDVQRAQDSIPSRNGSGKARSFSPPWMLDYQNKHSLTDAQLEEIDWAPLIKSGEVKP